MSSLQKLFNKTSVCQLVSKFSYFNVLQCRTRNLYSGSIMGLDGYKNVREKTKIQFASSEDKFKSKMAEFADEKSKHMIFTEDLKSMIHIVESNKEDLEIVHSMIRKFNMQNRELRFGSFVFGPVIMRMYHYLNKPKEALAVFKDESLAGIFDQMISFQLLMDLLFNNEQYDDIIEVFYIIKDKQLQPQRYPKNVIVLLYAALYKQNTPEAFALATEVWQELKKGGLQPMRRATTFAAALALNQSAPHIALEILSNEIQQNYITVRNLKARALAELGRPDDILPLLRSVLTLDEQTSRKHTFTEDTMKYVREAMDRCSEKEIVAEYQRIEKQLEMHSLIDSNTVDSFLCQEIIGSPFFKDANQRSQILAGSYNRRLTVGGGGGSRYRQRPGLQDMN